MRTGRTGSSASAKGRRGTRWTRAYRRDRSRSRKGGTGWTDSRERCARARGRARGTFAANEGTTQPFRGTGRQISYDRRRSSAIRNAPSG